MNTGSEDFRDRPDWLCDEYRYAGVDYSNLETARAFDQRHQRFRDYDAEFARIRERTGLQPSDAVLDAGCGTGAFVVPAAQYCRSAYGIDASSAMLAILQEKLDARGLTNVRLERAGFLDFPAPDEPVDVAITSIALHHLPDFWKGVALERLARAVRPGGVLYLNDVVFTFPLPDWRSGTQRLLDEMAAATSSDGMGKEAKKHISSEFSTFSWIVEGLLHRAGFDIERYWDDTGFMRAYLCRRRDDRQSSSPIVSVAEARAVDAAAKERLHIPTLLLMENAARSLADVFLAHAREISGIEPKKILICAGKGNNGGDGFALFRRLTTLGRECRVCVCARPEDYRGDAAVNFEIVRAMTQDDPQRIFYCDGAADSLARLSSELDWADWSVDAMLGTGATGALRSPVDAVAERLNDSATPVYAVDLPSGLDADSGVAAPNTVRATMTTTLALYKKGLLAESAAPFVGRLFLGDIGVPAASLLSNEESQS